MIRLASISLGYAFLALGVIGLFLPIFQGGIFLFLGLLILARHAVWAQRLLAWLKELQTDALLGDPGRSYFPKTGVEKLSTYNVQVTRDLEDREIRETSVYRFQRPGGLA